MFVVMRNYHRDTTMGDLENDSSTPIAVSMDMAKAEEFAGSRTDAAPCRGPGAFVTYSIVECRSLD